MENSNPILVMKNIDEVNSLKIEYISNDNIPEFLNGESGFHIYHVRMLTELILKQLNKTNPYLGLTDEQISAIAIASSLHDIGKCRIPKSILEFPGKLSPVEYDIVKKHSVFGEEIIGAICSDIDETVIKYAKEIARSHHERYDGTGYPDALKADDIPLSAQVVSLADAFDALTSARSYKQAFSQDVAIEMIANGMCGVFNSEHIEALLQVVNDRVLVDIRDKVKKARSVVLDETIFEPKNVLLVGNTGYIDSVITEEIFPRSRIVILGECDIKSTPRIRVYRAKNPSVDSVFDTYDFDIIIYFSNELTYNLRQKSDAEELRKVLECTCKTQKRAKFLYLSSLDGAFEESTDRGLLSKSKEELCEYYRKEFSVDAKIVRIPYLYSSTKKDDFLYIAFQQMSRGEVVTFDEKEGARSYFLSSYDLGELISRFVDNWKPGVGILNINDEFNISFGRIAVMLKMLKSDTKVEFSGNQSAKNLSTNNKAVRNEYGWFSKISILEDFEEQYENFWALKGERDTSFWGRIKQFISENTLVVKIFELFALFIICEILLKATGSSVIFSIVDFRMAYIVIMAMVHGLSFGIAAAGLSSVSWLVAKMISGTKWLTIFYEPTNWLAFVFYFMIGAVCGYVRLKKDDHIAFLQDENKLIEEKLIFTRELYNDTFNEKRDLKKQIIGSKDSFGKIFDVTKSLDTVEPRELYLKIMDTFEDILENKSISVYSINENSAFGRLEVASREIINDVARSISLDTYRPIVEKISGDDVWKNTELIEGFPMYAAGVSRDGKLELVIFIWYVLPEQRSLYYMNLFKIMRNLVQISLLRAYKYNQALYEKQYIPGTHILNPDVFENVFANFKRLSERKVSSYIALEIDCKGYSYSQVSEMLEKRIRANDILGVDKAGRLFLLLSQATEKDLAFVLPRFDSLDIDVKVLKNN